MMLDFLDLFLKSEQFLLFLETLWKVVDYDGATEVLIHLGRDFDQCFTQSLVIILQFQSLFLSTL
jgi:hypothetical protein